VTTLLQTDLDRFNAFYEAHHDHLKSFISRLIFNPEDAANVCQDIWLKVYLGIPYAHTPSVPWLFQIAKRTAIDEMRKIGRRGWQSTSLDFDLGDGRTMGETIEDQAGGFIEQVIIRLEIARILDVLNPFHAEALRMKVAGYRDDEISEHIGRHGKSAVLRGRRDFRARWEKEEEKGEQSCHCGKH
jgi:DNA-directed RNA polymerase specialized sigma24 family protein